MGTEEHKALVRRVVEAFNQNDWDAVDELFAPDYVDHDRSRVGLPPGPAGVKQAWGMLRAAFPDLRATIKDVIAEGDQVAVRGAICGTHRGELMGIAPTGEVVTMALIDINRIADGRLAERWGEADMLGLLQQLGVIPAPASAPEPPATSVAAIPAGVADADAGSPEANKALVRRFIEDVINRGNLAVANELFAPTMRFRIPGMDLHGPEGMKQLSMMLHAGFPDWAETIEALIADGDRVAVRLTGRGAHGGAFMGVPPTGRRVEAGGMAIFRCADGLIVEGWGMPDLLGLLRQVGAMPASAPAHA